MATLSIFANFYINDKERFLRLKDSFISFKDIDAEKWIINTRGKYTQEVLIFLKERLGEKLIMSTMESNRGWFHDTKKMLKNLNTDYIFFWVEDHINLVNTKIYKDIINEMKKSESDYLNYSWWRFGRPLKIYKNVEKNEHANTYSFKLTKEIFYDSQKVYTSYIISMQSIFSKKLFKKIINSYSLFLRSYSKQCPFDFEKGPGEINWLPINYSIPKYELFVSIDDDNNTPGYSLQSRGLYPKRKQRNTPNTNKKLVKKNKKKHISKFIKKIVPKEIYSKLIKIIIFFEKLKRYLYLLSKKE